MSAADTGCMTNTSPVHTLRRLTAAAAVCVSVAVALAGPASATTGQLDQSYSASGPGGFVEVQQTVAQTFTPSVSGDLTDIGVELWTYTGNPGMPVQVEVTATTAGSPDDSNVLGTGTIASNAIGSSAAFETTPITGTPYLVAGQQYAIVLSVSTNGSGGYYETSTNYSNGYAGGTAWWEFNSTPPFSDAGWDDAFETFMTPAAPPLSGGGGPRGAYCTVAGNTTDSGQPLTRGHLREPRRRPNQQRPGLRGRDPGRVRQRRRPNLRPGSCRLQPTRVRDPGHERRRRDVSLLLELAIPVGGDGVSDPHGR